MLAVVCDSAEEAGVPSVAVWEAVWTLLPVLFDCVEEADGCFVPM